MSSAYLQYVVSGLTLGSIYGLVALGLTVMFNATGMVNFAQGQTVMLGAMVTYTFLNKLGWGWPAGIVASIGAAIVLGWLLFRLTALRPRQHYEYTPVLLTLAFGTVLQGLAMLLWGKDPVRLPNIIKGNSLVWDGVAVQPQALLVMGAAVVIVVIITLFFRTTYTGKAMLATAENPVAAEFIGINTNRMTLLTMVLGSILGAVAGLLVAPITLMSFHDGDLFLLKGLSAMVVGGMTSIGGAVVGGIIIGLAEALAAGATNALFKDTISLVIMVLILFLRPSGLFGKSS